MTRKERSIAVCAIRIAILKNEKQDQFFLFFFNRDEHETLFTGWKSEWDNSHRKYDLNNVTKVLLI